MWEVWPLMTIAEVEGAREQTCPPELVTAGPPALRVCDPIWNSDAELPV